MQAGTHMAETPRRSPVELPALTAKEALPGVVFAMRYPSEIGYVWNSIARTYDRAAELLAPAVRCFLAYPRLCPDPAYQPRSLRPIEGDFYCTARANRGRLTSLIQEHGLTAVVYMGCAPSEISLRFLRQAGLRTLNGEHNAIPADASQSWWKRTAKGILRGRLHYNIHDLYAANSEHQRQFLLAFAGLPPERVRTVANGIDTDLFTPGPRPDPAELGLPLTDHFALTVCQARSEKRVEFLLDVAARLFRQRPDLSLTFVHVGDGPCLQDWRQQAEALGLLERFVFLGFRNEVVPLHRLASLLVHSCDVESFGLALAEAMAVGNPVVATDAPGPREVVADGETGFLVRRGDVDGFAAAVLRCLDDGDLRGRLGAAGRQRVVQRFSLKGQAEQLSSIIHDGLLGRRWH